MEPLVRPVQDLLALHPGGYRVVDVVGQLQAADALGEPRPGVLRGLQQAWHDRRLERPEQPGPLVPLDECLLTRPEAGAHDALPLGVLNLKGVQRGEKRLGLRHTAGDPRPVADVVVGGRLAPVLQLGHLRWRP